jgi:hypothetical protein
MSLDMLPNFTTLLELALLAGSPKIIKDICCNSSVILISYKFELITTFGE